MISIKETLIKLFRSNKKNLLYKNKEILKIITNLNLIKKIYFRLRNNQERIINFKFLYNLKKQILEGNFKWSHREFNSNKIIFNLRNRIVQMLLEIILSVIYEPNFQILEYNYGFRYKRNVQKSLLRLKLQKQKWWYSCKVRSSQNINDVILLKILKKKIADPTILYLVSSLPKKKILLSSDRLNILLYNIYIHEFDLYFSSNIKNLKNQYQKKAQENNKNFNFSKNSFFSQVCKKRKQSLLLKTLFGTTNFTFSMFKKAKYFLKKQRMKQIEFWISIQRRKRLQVIYNRHYKDWLIFTNCHLNKIKKIYNKSCEWFQKKLKLGIDNIIFVNLIKSKLNYIGFTISNSFFKIKQIDYLNKIKAKRQLLSAFFIGIDHKYLRSKLLKNKMITLNEKANNVNVYYNLKIFQILNKFQQKLKLLIKYYCNTLSHIADLNYYLYIYKLSFLKTLSRKMKKTTAYTFATHLKKIEIITKKDFIF